jgi:hypothetical protein
MIVRFIVLVIFFLLKFGQLFAVEIINELTAEFLTQSTKDAGTERADLAMKFTTLRLDLSFYQPVDLHQGDLVRITLHLEAALWATCGSQVIIFYQLLKDLGNVVFGKTGYISYLLGVEQLGAPRNQGHAMDSDGGSF